MLTGCCVLGGMEHEWWPEADAAALQARDTSVCGAWEPRSG